MLSGPQRTALRDSLAVAQNHLRQEITARKLARTCTVAVQTEGASRPKVNTTFVVSDDEGEYGTALNSPRTTLTASSGGSPCGRTWRVVTPTRKAELLRRSLASPERQQPRLVAVSGDLTENAEEEVEEKAEPMSDASYDEDRLHDGPRLDCWPPLVIPPSPETGDSSPNCHVAAWSAAEWHGGPDCLTDALSPDAEPAVMRGSGTHKRRQMRGQTREEAVLSAPNTPLSRRNMTREQGALSGYSNAQPLQYFGPLRSKQRSRSFESGQDLFS
mmetsp:Transcript_23718/g.67347  ORF Transcript_23718/g.67347 Transcript_23718/m.67347 type:complete len:273 (-) Transcript_23718:53-871(-)